MVGEAQRKTSRRRFRAGRRRKSASTRIIDEGTALLQTPQEPEEELRLCPLCGKRIKDIYSAIAFGEEHVPVHFECAVEAVRTARGLTADEQLCYIGKGIFGVVSVEASGAFTVRERIPWEEGSEWPSWRKGLLMIKRS